MKLRISPTNITSLSYNEIFVFGSNADGNHAGGAARFATEKFGAIQGQGHGLQGQSYAIDSMSGLEVLAEEVSRFTEFAKQNPGLSFLVTEIGCGIAGYKPEEITPLFSAAFSLSNVFFPESFTDILTAVRGYKVTRGDMTCHPDAIRDPFQYEIGKIYIHKGEVKVCGGGFHYCKLPQHCFNYYSFTRENRVFEIEAFGNMDHGDDKSAAEKIHLIREIPWEEVLLLVNIGVDNMGHSNTGDRNTGDRNTGRRNTGDRNTGNGNTGYGNTGDWNTGDWNTGDRNTGEWNTGDRNTGRRNTGDRNTGRRNAGNGNTGDRNTGNGNTGYGNTGDRNTGDRNTGNWNTGDRNTGDWNTGDRNTGDWNTGDRNTGRRNAGNGNTGDRNTGNGNTGYGNTGDWNTGDRNTGNWNTGDRNTGDWNTGNGNTGDRNAGYWNTGDRNTGNWNTGDRNTGYGNTGNRNTGLFCTEDAPFPIFDQVSGWTEEEFLQSKVYSLLGQVDTKLWVPEYLMSEEEKVANRGWKTAEGFVRDIPFKQAFQDRWHNWGNGSRQAFLDLPNFDAEKFEHITGVKV